MTYGARQYGLVRYGTLSALTLTRSFSESLGYDSFGDALNLIEKNYSESLGFSDFDELRIVMFETEAIGYNDNYNRTLDAFRTYSDSASYSDAFSKTGDFQRTYLEAEGLNTNSMKVLERILSESAGYSDQKFFTVAPLYSEAEGLSTGFESATFLERLYSESQGFSTVYDYAIIKIFQEAIGYSDEPLERGDNLIRIRFLNLAEELGLVDFGYKLVEIQDIDDPNFMIQFLEKYDFGLDIGEPEFDIHVG